MTNQEIFDTVVRHLWTQGKQSINKNGECVYRGPKGTKCAVGCLIPDDKYNPRMDDRAGANMALADVMIMADIPSDHGKLLAALQSAHDNERNWDISGPNENMVGALQYTAATYHVDPAVLMKVSA